MQTNVKVCCGRKAKCYDSRLSGAAVRRRYHCVKCGKAWSSVELQIDGKRIPAGPGTAESKLIEQSAKRLRALSDKQQTVLTEFLRAFRGFGKVT